MDAAPRDPAAAAAAGRVRVEVGAGRDYDILLGAGLLTKPKSYAAVAADVVAVVVSNSTVAPLYGAALVGCLRTVFRSVALVELADGEEHKTWQTAERIVDALLAAQADRKAVLFALGGGVVGDLTGFAAACYMRGISYVQVPTTLLAQVDSSVGGKTGINHPLGKNLIGAFHQPSLVVIDVDVLDTLPQREFIAGMAEVIKCAFVADASFVSWLEVNLERAAGAEQDGARSRDTALLRDQGRRCRRRRTRSRAARHPEFRPHVRPRDRGRARLRRLAARRGRWLWNGDGGRSVESDSSSSTRASANGSNASCRVLVCRPEARRWAPSATSN